MRQPRNTLSIVGVVSRHEFVTSSTHTEPKRRIDVGAAPRPKVTTHGPLLALAVCNVVEWVHVRGLPTKRQPDDVAALLPTTAAAVAGVGSDTHTNIGSRARERVQMLALAHVPES